MDECTDGFADCLRGVKGGNLFAMTIKEVRSVFAVEGFVQVGGEEEASSTTANLLTFRMSLKYGIQSLTVKGSHVLDVTLVLQTTFNFKRDDACFQHSFDIIGTAHVLERKQMFVAYQRFAAGILQVETGAANLGALSPIAASARHHPANVALSAVTHTQRTVYKSF